MATTQEKGVYAHPQPKALVARPQRALLPAQRALTEHDAQALADWSRDSFAGQGSAVSLLSYGAAGAIGEAAMQQAVADAQSAGKAIDLAGQGVQITHTLNLTGVAGLVGVGMIDGSGVPDAAAILSVTGQRTLLASGLSLAAGATSMSVGAGHVIEDGDVILVTSAEPSINQAESYFYKGQRCYAHSYDAATGELRFYAPLLDDYAASAYVWRVAEAALRLGADVSVVGDPGKEQTGLVATYARILSEGAFRRTRKAGLRLDASSALVQGTIRGLRRETGGATTYGVSVNDLSEVVMNAQISGCWHAVASGGGTWDAGDSGGTAGQSAAYPARVSIPGGTYLGNPESNIAVVDAHGIVESLSIGSAAIIHGGVQTGARFSTIAGQIHYYGGNGGIYVRQNTSPAWCSVVLASPHVIAGPSADTPYLRSEVPMRSLTGTLHTSGLASPTAQPIKVYSDCGFFDLGGTVEVAAETDFMQMSLTCDAVIRLRHDGVKLQLEARRAGLTATVTGSCKGAPNRGLDVRASGVEAGRWALVALPGARYHACGTNGVYVKDADRVDLSGALIYANGQQELTGGGGDSVYVEDADEVRCAAADLHGDGRQGYGLRVYRDEALGKPSTQVSLIGSDFRGAKFRAYRMIGAAEVVRQIGCEGIERVIAPDGSESDVPMRDLLENPDLGDFAAGNVSLGSVTSERFVTPRSGVADGQATLDLSAGSFFRTAHTAATTMTGVTSATEGQRFVLYVDDANTTVEHQRTTGGFDLIGKASYDAPATTTMVFQVIDGVAQEVGRSTLAPQPRGVAALSQTISNPPTQAEVQAVSDKLNELIAALNA